MNENPFANTDVRLRVTEMADKETDKEKQPEIGKKNRRNGEEIV